MERLLEDTVEELKSMIRDSFYPEKELLIEEFESNLRLNLEHYQTEEKYFQEPIFNEIKPLRSYQKYEESSTDRLSVLLAIYDVFIVPMIILDAIGIIAFNNGIEINFDGDRALLIPKNAFDLSSFDRLGNHLFPSLYKREDFFQPN